MSSAEECREEIDQEVSTFEGIVYFSLGLTAVSFIATVAYKQKLLDHPKFAWKLYFGLSGVKLIIGLLLFTAFTPKCPTDCGAYCGTYHPSYVYPSIVMVIGLLWARRGKKFYDLDQASGQDGIQGTEMKTDVGNEVI